MKLFVWDFHGVLEKGNDDSVLEITNLALERHGYSRRMSREESFFLSGRHWHEYFAYLLPEDTLEEWNTLQSTCFEISQNQIDIVARNIRLNDHADLVLEAIHNSEHTQILISNTLPHHLDMFVKVVEIEKYFPSTHRFGVNAHQQKSLTKKHCLQEYIRDKQHFKTIISIGDSPGDMALIEIDEKIQGVGYLYTHPTRQHRPAHCHHKIHDLRIVLQEVHYSCNNSCSP